MSRYYDIGILVGAGGTSDVPDTQRTSADGADSIAMANAEAATKDIDAKIDNLARTWKPTGYYRIEELQKVMNETLGLIREAARAINDAPRSTGDSETQIKQALDRLWRNGSQAMVFVENMRATKPGALVAAPGLKDWVLRSLNNCSMAYQTASVLKENAPWYVAAIVKFQTIFNVAIKIIALAGQLVWDGIEALLDIPISAAKKLGWNVLGIVAGIVGVAGVGYIIVKRETK